MPTNQQTAFIAMAELSDEQIAGEFAGYGSDQNALERMLALVDAGISQSKRALQIAAMAWRAAKVVAAALGTTIEIRTGSRRDFLNRIAENRIDAEALWELGASDARESLAARILSMPVELQRRYIVDRERVSVAERDASGEITSRELLVTEVPASAYKLVFTRSGIRGLAEQKAMLAHAGPKRIHHVAVTDLESLRAEILKQVDIVVTGDKRERKRAGRELCSLSEKIMLLVS